jgi:hypothetical protein
MVRGARRWTPGLAILTTERVLFFKLGFFRALFAASLLPPSMGGWIGGPDNTPLLDLPLDTITAVERRGRRGYPDRLALVTDDTEYVFNGGWDDWSRLLLEMLEARGRRG